MSRMNGAGATPADEPGPDPRARTGSGAARPQRRGDPIFPLRDVVLAAFLPSFVFQLGVGAMLPLIPARTTALGGDLAAAGLVAMLLPVGGLLAALPAGSLVARVGDRRAMAVAGTAGAIGFTATALAPTVVVLAAGVALIGATAAVFNLARQTYLTAVTPPLRRARVFSTLGGVHRIGSFVGPFVGAGLVLAVGLDGGFWLGVATSILAVVIVIVVRPSPEALAREAATTPTGEARRSLWSVLTEHRHMLATLGGAVMLVSAIRSTRQAAMPLWAEHLGIDPALTSVVVGLSSGIDMLLFYPAGKAMDSFGRLWVSVPAMVIMTGGLVALPFTSSAAGLTVVAIVLGLGNGISSGVLMTLGSDVAPPGERAQFLSLWRVQSDLGALSAPVVLATGAALGSLAAGVWVMVGAGAMAAVALARWVPRWSVHATRATRRRAGIE